MWSALNDTALGQGCMILKNRLFADSTRNVNKDDQIKEEEKMYLDENSSDLSYVFGSVLGAAEGFYIVDVKGEEHFESADNLQWNFIKGDKVRMNASKEEQGFGGATKLNIVPGTIVPASFKTHNGRVTSIDGMFTMIDKRFVLVNSSYDDEPDLVPQLHQEYKFNIIESTQPVNGSSFEWRIVKILEKLDPPTADQVAANIIMNDVSHSIRQSAHNVVTKFVQIENKSNIDIKMIRCEFTKNTSHLIKLDYKNDESKPVDVQSNSISKVYLTIFPRRIGNDEAIFTAQFETLTKDVFEKQCKISVEIYSVNNVPPPPQPVTNRFEAKHFDDYAVPESLSAINLSKRKEAVVELLNTYEFWDEDLSMRNYLHKMHFGVYFEELAMGMAFAAYHIKKTHFENEDNYLKLTVKGVSEKRPSILIGDTIEASSLNNTRVSYKGRIEKVENDAILVKFYDEFHENHRNNLYMIDFNFSRKIYRQFHHALDTIVSPNGLGYEFLFPQRTEPLKHPRICANLKDGNLTIFNKELEWYDKKLNIYQKEAVVNALHSECRPYPYIIYGPPGTGKTMTVVELIKQLFYLDPKARLIVATPSNSAANLFTQALINFGRFKGSHDFVRFVSHNQIEKDLIPPELRNYCARIDTSNVRRRELPVAETDNNSNDQVIKSCAKQEIVKYRVCISTLNCFGALMKIDLKAHFTHVIIDEAGQSIEPEMLIPLTLLKKETGNVILSGDPQQLGPMLSSPFAKQLELDSSLLERLLSTNHFYSKTHGPEENEYNPRFVTKLKKNYRSLPSVLHVYNDFFYNNELEGVISDRNSSEADLLSIIHDKEILWNRKESNKKCGVYFVNVLKGRNDKVRDSCSWHNKTELNSLFSFLNNLSSKGIKLADIGVITPYALQVKKLKQRLSMLTDTDLKIGTVEEFQGQERHIIIVSTVRTEETHFKSDKFFGLGFLQCPKRMNVVISRARTLMVIFGNGNLLEKDEHWNKLIEYTKKNNTYVIDNRA